MTSPDNLKLLQGAEIAYQKGDFETARQLIRQALSHDRADAQAWWALATVAEDTSKQQIALRKVLEIDPQHAEARTLVSGYSVFSIKQVKETGVYELCKLILNRLFRAIFL